MSTEADRPANFAPFEALMREDGQPELAITIFRHYFERAVAGTTGLIPESSIEPVPTLRNADLLDEYRPRGHTELDKVVVIKLNGGLGTSMAMDRAKSLLPVKDGRSFLDIIAAQIVHQRVMRGARLPLVLMDSFRTADDTREALREKGTLRSTQRLPPAFEQHRIPKIVEADWSPAPLLSPRDELGWCPPGHGNIYPALATSGLLKRCREDGFRWAFVSNADNLGATMDDVALGILGWMAEERLPFVMECAKRTASDKKGGHLAQREKGELLLREVAQCPPDELDAFQDIARHRFFNTNNLWLDLEAVGALLERDGWYREMPLILNRKPLDPGDPTSPAALQLETAMGAAISLLAGASAVRSPRDRFLPVKTTNDLLVLRSDAFTRTAEGYIKPTVDRMKDLPRVDLDPRYFRNIDDFNGRVRTVPSLAQARSLTVRGDVRFDHGVIVRGDVAIDHSGPEPLVLADCTLGS